MKQNILPLLALIAVGCSADSAPAHWTVTQLPGANVYLTDVWGSSANDVYVTGISGSTDVVYHSTDGAQWTPLANGIPAGAGHGELAALWGSGASDVYLGGAAGIYHSAGDGNWSSIFAGGTGAIIVGLWGSAAGDVYAVGDGTILHARDGVTFGAENLPLGAADFHPYRISGRSASEVVLVGNYGLLAVSDGSGAWNVIASEITGALEDVWSAPGNDLFVAGEGGVILRFNPSTGAMTSEATGLAADDFFGVAGRVTGAALDVWVVGTRVLHSNGDGHWTEEPLSSAEQLTSVWVAKDGQVFATSTTGAVLHRQ